MYPGFLCYFMLFIISWRRVKNHVNEQNCFAEDKFKAGRRRYMESWQKYGTLQGMLKGELS